MMKKFTSTFKILAVMLGWLLSHTHAHAQKDSGFIKRMTADTGTQKLNMDAVYNRPFLSAGKLPLAIGGYLEANTQYEVTDGVSEGFSFQARRFTLFLSSTIAKRIKFLSELEFEDGTKEINIETALMDIEFHSLLNFRSGILMNPIGAFNQNHDGPRWDFIDRPLSATTIIPSTLSNVGMGFHGKYIRNNWIIGYEAYLTNGFDDKIISNTEGRTSLAAGKQNKDRFEESFSGLPMFSGKLALRNRKIGELGLSVMSGVYNKFEDDGIVLDVKRNVRVAAVDFNTSLFKNKLNITGEISHVQVDVPSTYIQSFGSRQMGAYGDIIYTVLQRKILKWEKARFNLGLRFDYADYNLDYFNETGNKIMDHVWAIVPAIAFRPAGSTVLRLNYRYQKQTDLLGNPPSGTGALQFGFSTYF